MWLNGRKKGNSPWNCSARRAAPVSSVSAIRRNTAAPSAMCSMRSFSPRRSCAPAPAGCSRASGAAASACLRSAASDRKNRKRSSCRRSSGVKRSRSSGSRSRAPVRTWRTSRQRRYGQGTTISSTDRRPSSRAARALISLQRRCAPAGRGRAA